MSDEIPMFPMTFDEGKQRSARHIHARTGAERDLEEC